MLVIRLRRTGKKGEPTYRIVVAEETAPIQGKIVAQLGHYNPKTKEIVLNKEVATEWMNKGAKPSNTVAKIMTKQKMDHKSIVIHKNRPATPKKKVEGEEAKAATTQASKEVAPETAETPETTETSEVAEQPTEEKTSSDAGTLSEETAKDAETKTE